MLPELDETLKQLVIRELPIANSEVELSFDPPKRDWAVGWDFGPGTQAKVQEQIEAAINAQGNKTRDQWETEMNRLNALSLQRDRPPGASAPTLKSDGEPVSCPEDCFKMVGTTMRAPWMRLPGDSSETLTENCSRGAGRASCSNLAESRCSRR